MKTLTTEFAPVAHLDDAAARWHQQHTRSFLAAMRRKLGLIVLLGAAGLGAAATWLSLANPEYSGTSLVQLDMRSKVSSFDNVVTSPKDWDPSIIRTEIEVLRSNAIAERVVKILDLTNDPEFTAPRSSLATINDWTGDLLKSWVTKASRLLDDYGGGTHASAEAGDSALPLPGRSQDDRVALTVRQVRKKLSIEADGRSYIITIGFAASSPEKAAQITNALAQQYLAAQIDAKTAVTASANEWAKSQLDSAGVQLRDAEAAIEKFRAQHEAIIEVAPGNSVAVSQQFGQLLAQLNVQLATVAQARIATETRVAAAREMVKRQDLYAIPEVQTSPLLQALRAEEARLSARRAHVESGLGRQHPEVTAATRELARVQESIRSKVEQVVAGLASDAQVARRQEEELAAKVDSLRRKVGEASEQQLQLSILERRADARRAFYAALEKRYVETSALLHGVYPDARVVSPATPQPVPSWPNTGIVLAGGLLVGAAIGALLVALLEIRDKTFRTASQLEAATGVPCLGILPDLGRRFHGRTTGNLRARSSRLFREAVRTIFIAMSAALGADSQRKRRGQVILVTSALPQDGKTVSSVALASAAAASGSKTLLIDADLRRPRVEGYLPAEWRSQDLAAVLASGQTSAGCTQIDTNLYAIRGSAADENAQRLFLSTEFDAFMQTATADFDTVVIDSPPALVVADAAILARHADAVVHVVRWGQTPRSNVLAAVDRLRRANGNAIGATMLNCVDPSGYRKYNRDGGWTIKYADYYRPAPATSTVNR
jgi:succinoglycan biosynthesis transport protein ExoP